MASGVPFGCAGECSFGLEGVCAVAVVWDVPAGFAEFSESSAEVVGVSVDGCLEFGEGELVAFWFGVEVLGD